MSQTIAVAVAEHTDTDPLSLEPLFEAIDPEALDALYAGDRSGGTPRRVSFTYAGCTVEITDDGEVHVSDGDESSSAKQAVTRTNE